MHLQDRRVFRRTLSPPSGEGAEMHAFSTKMNALLTTLKLNKIKRFLYKGMYICMYLFLFCCSIKACVQNKTTQDNRYKIMSKQ